jgi:PAS domain S-box-containing protein
MRAWIAARLDRKILFCLGVEMLTASVVFLVLFLGLYNARLEQERGAASAQVNRLLQVALENAMLKRDLDGLRDIIFYLGQQENIRRVSIVNPAGEVRFSSLPETVNGTMAIEPGGGGMGEGQTRFLVDEFGHEVLRSINPVHNREPCTRCHGPVAEHPINGILVVDYDAASLRHSAIRTGLLLLLSGGLVVLAALAATWWMLRRFVLRPVAHLREASAHLAAGDLSFRARLDGPDELAQLGRAFNDMAVHLTASLEAVRSQEAFLQAVIDTVPDGIRVLDQDFTIVKANAAYCRQVGRSMADVVGARCYASSHGRAEPCAATLVICPLAEIAQLRQPVKAMHCHCGVDGGDMPVEVHAAPLEMPDGRVLVIEAIRDLAADIRFSHEQKLSALGQLAAGVAHEIRNPLASVRLALQGTMRSIDQGQLNGADLSNYLRLVDGQVDKCIDVSDRLLRLAINNGGQRQLVSVNPAVRETLSLLAWEAQENGIAIGMNLSPDEPRVMIDDGELRMLVLNLAQNAFHALPQGGALEVTTGYGEDGAVELLFKDNGVGILPEHLPRIFDPFFSHRANGSDGAGLGLTICRGIVERVGGTISVVSRVGEGTTFAVRLHSAEEDMA